jgi:hypothetical protein
MEGPRHGPCWRGVINPVAGFIQGEEIVQPLADLSGSLCRSSVATVAIVDLAVVA